MGLLYPFPVDSDETDHVISGNHTLLLKSYGLPYLFWGYLLGGLSVIALLSVLSWPLLTKMLSSQDSLNVTLAIFSFLVLLGTPLGFTLFFFIEFRLLKKGNTIIKSLYLLGLPLYRRSFQLRSEQPFEIEPFFGTPQ